LDLINYPRSRCPSNGEGFLELGHGNYPPDPCWLRFIHATFGMVSRQLLPHRFQMFGNITSAPFPTKFHCQFS